MRESSQSETRVLRWDGSVSGVVLAGGESRRMGGKNKALLKIGDLSIIERVTRILVQVLPHVILITNSPEDFRFLGLPMFRDLRPGYGALGGLYTGLKKCPSDFGLLVACDMPFLNAGIIKLMVLNAQDHEVIVPRVHGKLEPLHAIYSKSSIPHIEELMDNDDLRIFNFFNKVNVLELDEKDLRPLDPDLRFIMNLNTPEDLKRAQELA
jgi:molybdopterin-guanine dinucleotide biosynthesis protein A